MRFPSRCGQVLEQARIGASMRQCLLLRDRQADNGPYADNGPFRDCRPPM